MESHILKKVRRLLLNTAGILKILNAKFKYNIATYNLDVFNISTKQTQLIYS